MSDQREEAVRKGAHCAWQLHYHSLTTREIFRRKPAVKRVLWGGECWRDKYDVATVGERANWQPVERYVPRQGQPQADLRQLRMF